MSCEGHRDTYFETVEANQPGASVDELDTIYQTAKNRPAFSDLEDTIATAKTRKLFADMQGLGIKPPTHSSSGLPRKSSRRGYAAVYDHLVDRGYFGRDGNRATPETTGEAKSLTAQAEGNLTLAGLPEDTQEDTASSELWRYIPRCARCGRFMPTQNPVCSNPRCGFVGEKQGEPVPWPPPGFSFKRSRVLAQLGRVHEQTLEDLESGVLASIAGADIDPDSPEEIEAAVRAQEEFEDSQAHLPAVEDAVEPDEFGYIPGEGSAFNYIPKWMRKKIPPLYGVDSSENPTAIIKLFTPDSNFTHYVLEYDGNDTCFVLTEGFETELGYLSLSEMRQARGGLGLRLERDLWFRPTPIRDLAAYEDKWGAGGPYRGRQLCPNCGEPMTKPHVCVDTGAEIEAGGHTLRVNNTSNVGGTSYTVSLGEQTTAIEVVNEHLGDGEFEVTFYPGGDGERPVQNDEFTSLDDALGWAAANMHAYAAGDTHLGQRCAECGQFMALNHICPIHFGDVPDWARLGGRIKYQRGNGDSYTGEIERVSRYGITIRVGPEENDVVGTTFTSPSITPITEEPTAEREQVSDSAVSEAVGQRCPKCHHSMTGASHVCPASLDFALSSEDGAMTAYIEFDGDRYWGSFQPTPDSNPITSAGMTNPEDARTWAANIVEEYHQAASTAGNDVAEATSAPEATNQTQSDPTPQSTQCANCGQFMDDDHVCPGPKFVFVTDVYGKRHRVRQSDLDGDRPVLRLYNQYGERVASGAALARGNIAKNTEEAHLRRLSAEELERRIVKRDLIPPDETNITLHRVTDLVEGGDFFLAFADDQPTGMQAETPEILRSRLDNLYGDTVYQVAAGIGFEDGGRLSLANAGDISSAFGRCEYCGAFLDSTGVCHNPKCPAKRSQATQEAPENSATVLPPSGIDAAAPPESSPSSPEPEDDPLDEDAIEAADDTLTARGVDYVIAADDEIGVGGPKAKVRGNIAAIRLLKQLEEESRLATPEEQKILVGYVGWGAFPQVFDHKNQYWQQGVSWVREKPPFFEEWEEVKDLLSEDEWNAASRSTVNAHYTSPTVIRAMWDALDQMGFDRKDGNILEPAAGVGHFFGLMPDEYKASKRVGIELDDTTAAIAKHLYQNADIRNAGFENTPLPDGFFDLAISNVPFGNYGVVDKEFKGRDRFLTESIHNYFFAKGLRKVKPGGVVAFITSRYTLDSTTHARVRERLAEQADLVGAIRLPNTAFKGNAGTEVTTDIIFLRKRAEDEPPQGKPWVGVQEIEGADGSRIAVNEYFAENPHMLLGQMEESGTMYARGQAQLVSDGRDLGEALDQAIRSLPTDALATPAGRCPACGAFMAQDGICNHPQCPSKRPATAQIRVMEVTDRANGTYVVQDSEVYRVEDEQLIPHEKAGQTTASGDKPMEIQRIRGMVAVNEVARRLLRLNVEEAGDEQLRAAQEELGRVYDAFVVDYGPINNNGNRRALSGDPNLAFLMALEAYDEDTGTAIKEAIFSRRTIATTKTVDHADTPADALRVSLDEGGGVNWQRMSALTGVSVDELQRSLRAEGLLYETPAGRWETAEEYLSGNVRQKLIVAEAAAAIDPRYQANLDALQAVMPRELEASDIKAALGSAWVPTSDIKDFTAQLFRGAEFNISYIAALAEWKVKPKSTKGWGWRVFKRDSAENTQIWGTNRAEAFKLLEQALNGQDPTVWDKVDTPDGEKRVVNEAATLAAREQQDKIKKEFERWIFDDEDRRERLVAKYNEEFNSEVPREFDGAHLTLPGLGASMPELRPHQKNAIWRITQGNNALLAHIVGAGKTFAMIGGGMELRRMGLRNKVMYAIPNHMLDQFSADIYRMYPAAKVLGIGAKDLSPAKRTETMSRIATGDWDAVVVTHSALGKLPVSAETQARFLREEVSELRAALDEAKFDGEKITVKEIEKKLARYETKLKQAQADAADKKDNTIEWEDLGVDQLFVDEADQFKNLDFATRRTRLSGVQGKASARASDMFMKIRSMGDRYGHGKGVVFATGTPIANSVSEMYNMQRFLDYDYLGRKGIRAFDAWANQFGDTVTSIEMKPSGGGYQTKTRFAQFNNVPELKRMFMRFADIQVDPDELNLKRPKLVEDEEGHRRQRGVVAPASDELKGYIGELIERADNLSNVDPSEDNMLKITGDGRKAALDMRLVDPLAEDDPNSKLNIAVGNIYDIYQKTTGIEAPGQEGPQNMAQMVFCDLGTPASRGEGFCVYDDIKAKLVARGIKPEEIAFIQECKSDDQKYTLFQRVNAGEVRVLIGSTETMGAGTNAQRRLAAMHHLDAPWRPRDVEQREGRILRHGNMNEEVGVFRYLTEGSFDVYNWQLLERKARFIAQVMNRDLAARSVEDVDAQALSYAEMKALATGNPAIIEQVAVDSELRKLESLERSHKQRTFSMQSKIGKIPEQIAKGKTSITRDRAAVAAIAQAQEVVGQREAQLKEDGEAARLRAKQLKDEAKDKGTPEAEERAAQAARITKSKADHLKDNGAFEITLSGRSFTNREKAGRQLRAIESEYLQGKGPGGLKEIGAYMGFPVLAKPGTMDGMSPQFYVQFTPELAQLVPQKGGSGLTFDDVESGKRNTNRLEQAFKVPDVRIAKTQEKIAGLERELATVQGAAGGAFEHQERLDYLRGRAKELATIIEEIEKSGTGSHQTVSE